MLYGKAFSLSRRISDGVSKMAMIESFAIHLRNILHFAYPEGKGVKNTGSTPFTVGRF